VTSRASSSTGKASPTTPSAPDRIVNTRTTKTLPFARNKILDTSRPPLVGAVRLAEPFLRRGPRLGGSEAGHNARVFAPRTQYARTRDGTHIAYQVLGEGPFDLVLVPDWWNHLEAQWEEPALARFLYRLASFSRLILFDKRGMGVSDPVAPDALPTLEDWIEDVRAVMEAAGSEQAAVLASSGGGPMGMLFAATYPDRISALVLINTAARIAVADDYPIGVSARAVDAYLDWLEEAWGTPAIADLYAPSMATDVRFREWFARLLRLSQSPGLAVAVQRMLVQADLRAVLPLISCPTLVVHRAGDIAVRAVQGRDVADHIRGSRYVELPGADHLLYTGDVDGLVDEVEEFLTGTRRHGGDADRVLATVLFTDIIDSTQLVTVWGDRRWQDVLDAHHGLVRRQIERYRGREINTTGDGFVITFDAPVRAIRCAQAISVGVRSLGIDVRAGLHTGEVQLMGDDVAGVAVHLGARVAALAGPGEVWVSRTVVDLVAGSGIEFSDQGEHELKGIDGVWRLFSVQAR
jgi:class 3 adenylate cyclase